MRIVIAGGGTGGHLFPGIAIAEEFVRRDNEAEIIFIGTKRGIENRLLGQLGYKLITIDVEGIKGRGPQALAKGIYQIPQSMWQSQRIFKKFRPQLVIGVGGYASGPAVLAACLTGVATAIAEQNAVPGITNRILGKFVDKIFLTYRESENWFSPAKVVVSGNPVRAAFNRLRGHSREKSRVKHLLIFGGSQGASAINKAVVEMLPQLSKIKDEIKVTHQTGLKEVAAIKHAYEKWEIAADVFPFINDMAEVDEAADLIICRAGATSLAEITTVGRAAILIPFPYAANDHQTKNAQALAAAGAAVMINESELTNGKLFAAVQELLMDETKLEKMAASSAAIGSGEASSIIVDSCLNMVAGRK